MAVDWDRDYDFESIKTYQWVEPKETPVSPLMQQRVEEAIQYNLAMRGHERVESGGDVLITYHGDNKDETVIHSDHFGMGYGGEVVVFVPVDRDLLSEARRREETECGS